MFKRKNTVADEQKEAAEVETLEEEKTASPLITLLGMPKFEPQEDGLPVLDLVEEFSAQATECSFREAEYAEIESQIKHSTALVALYPKMSVLDTLLEQVIEERSLRANGLPVVVIVVNAAMLTKLGEWLMKRAQAESLEGIRLVLAATLMEAIPEIVTKFTPITDPSVISMPSAPEVEDSPMNYFFAISPQIQKTVRTIEEYAENGVERIYLLGGPGSGKTTLAYYYWLKRNRGRFIAVNLNAESSGDKDSMKSLLCGHVSGAFPGASSREGAFSYSDGGVTFLDESHGVTGVVMQVLMEALDSGQYLPFGATKKRLLACAVIFASNRSWDQLRSEINLDEHARLGAMIVPVHDLVVRREDLIVGVAIALSRFKSKCRTWDAPIGLTEAAWTMITACPWRGNVRTLFRVMETALTAFGVGHEESNLLDTWNVQEGLNLWEPEDHHSHKIYTSYR